MRFRHSLLLVAICVIGLPGCDNGNADPFVECGNGILDPGEQCDDGNRNDLDDCLSTCVIAICGDGFINQRDEDCDGENLTETCGTLGFDGGTLSCDALCRFDTRQCIAPPTATRTATPPSTDTPSFGPTEPGGSPTPSPTATPPQRCSQADAIVALEFVSGLEVAGVDLQMDYEPDLVEIPGSGGDGSVIERTTDLTGRGGFLTPFDDDSDEDARDDRLAIAYVATGGTIEPADFVAVRFDCTENADLPRPDDFTCRLGSVSDPLGNDITSEVSCNLRVEPILVAPPSPTPTTPDVAPTATSTPLPTDTMPPVSTPSLTPPATLPPTATATETPRPGTPTTTGTPTPTREPTPVCGDGIVEPPETCDDGNTQTGDDCPTDCTIRICAPDGSMQPVSVTFAPPGDAPIASMTVLLEYPDGTVQLPGTGASPAVEARVVDRPPGFLLSSVDLDYALRTALAGSRALNTGPIYQVHFDHCTGAPTGRPQDFNCIVLEAFDTAFGAVPGVTCEVDLF